jgi:hypothetical protein
MAFERAEAFAPPPRAQLATLSPSAAQPPAGVTAALDPLRKALIVQAHEGRYKGPSFDLMGPDPSRGRVPAERWSEFVQWGERSGHVDGATLVREMEQLAETAPGIARSIKKFISAGVAMSPEQIPLVGGGAAWSAKGADNLAGAVVMVVPVRDNESGRIAGAEIEVVHRGSRETLEKATEAGRRLLQRIMSQRDKDSGIGFPKSGFNQVQSRAGLTFQSSDRTLSESLQHTTPDGRGRVVFEIRERTFVGPDGSLWPMVPEYWAEQVKSPAVELRAGRSPAQQEAALRWREKAQSSLQSFGLLTGKPVPSKVFERFATNLKNECRSLNRADAIEYLRQVQGVVFGETGNRLQISGGQPSFMQFNNIIRPMLDIVIEKLGVDPQRTQIPKFAAR